MENRRDKDGVEAILLRMRELCKNKEEAIALWQVCQTSELHAFFKRRRTWQANSLGFGNRRFLLEGK